MEDTTKKYRTAEFSIRLGTKWTMVTSMTSPRLRLPPSCSSA